jgi:EAL domain-containing protein (putative c-di-GMP-specific phosphodiesterase class I)
VETTAQLALLKKTGCDEYQGYLYSEPMPLGHLLDKIRSREPAPSSAVA